MAAIVTSAETERCVRTLLYSAGYLLSPPLRNGQTGVDVEASKDTEQLFIEVISYKQSGSHRAKDFYEIFFRAISRLNGRAKCIIALPKPYEKGLPQRAKHHGVAWQRIGVAFPELRIWLVDTVNRSITEWEWSAWLPGSSAHRPIRRLHQRPPQFKKPQSRLQRPRWF